MGKVSIREHIYKKALRKKESLGITHGSEYMFIPYEKLKTAKSYTDQAFKSKGAAGKEGGWVDCNAPDGKGGYKACGRAEGEKRKKYPACRPTPAACKERGKGKSWGKKAKKGKKG